MKRGVVIYYSQTGNTQQIAIAIRKGVCASLKDCDLFKLKDIQPEALKDYDLIGIGSPVWGGRPSPNIENFIENAAGLSGKHAFFFCTHGTIPGATIFNAIAALRKKGLKVIGWKNWYGNVFLPYMPKPYYTDGHPDSIDLEEAEQFGTQMAERSEKISQGSSHLIPELPQGKVYEEIYGSITPRPFPPELTESRYQPFSIDPEKCIGCGLCEENCPTDNIDCSGDLPLFKEVRCRRCWYCEQICPTGAIIFDWAKYHEDWKKYSNSGEDGRNKVLAEAEARGYFRRLIPEELIDEDKPWYKVSSHPRIKIP